MSIETKIEHGIDGAVTEIKKVGEKTKDLAHTANEKVKEVAVKVGEKVEETGRKIKETAR